MTASVACWLRMNEHKAAGVQHITFLSVYGMEHAPDKVAIRNVELDLLRRKKISHPSCVSPGSCRTSARRFSSRPAEPSVCPPGTVRRPSSMPKTSPPSARRPNTSTSTATPGLQVGLIQHSRVEIWSQTEVLHRGGSEKSKTTHPTAHPRVYFWYLK
jgi:hypothetical protein